MPARNYKEQSVFILGLQSASSMLWTTISCGCRCRTKFASHEHTCPTVQSLIATYDIIFSHLRLVSLRRLSCSLPGLKAALPQCGGVMVVPSLRRSASRCRGTLRPPAYAQLHCTLFSILSGFANCGPYFRPHILRSGSCLNFCQSPTGHVHPLGGFSFNKVNRESFPRL